MSNLPNIDTLIGTSTIITYNPNGTVNIVTTYTGGDAPPNVISTLIAQALGNTMGINFKEGELIAYLKNYPGQINLSINDKGELLLYTSSGDSQNYSIDGNGNLNYTKPI